MLLRDFLLYPLIYFGLIDSTEKREEKRENTIKLLNNEKMQEVHKISELVNNPNKYHYNKELIQNQIIEIKNILNETFKNNPAFLYLMNYLEGLVLYSKLN